MTSTERGAAEHVPVSQDVPVGAAACDAAQALHMLRAGFEDNPYGDSFEDVGSVVASEEMDPWSLPPATAPAAIVTAPAFVIVTSPDNAAAVKPVPSPMSNCVSPTAFAETTPELLASLTSTEFAPWFAIFANVTCASAM